MALVLNIDTATEIASVCVSRGGHCLAFLKNPNQKEHASFVNAAIKTVVAEAGVQLKDVAAFAVTSGPGSYTGLRVGMSTAKGFCYAFNKPLIMVNTLEVMAAAAIQAIAPDSDTLLCPMIDARRMEVFTALYDAQLKIVMEPRPWVLDEESFDNYMTKLKISFFGSGSQKFGSVKRHVNAVFESVEHSAKDLAVLADKTFEQKKFADVSYSEPEYFKDFHSSSN